MVKTYMCIKFVITLPQQEQKMRQLCGDKSKKKGNLSMVQRTYNLTNSLHQLLLNLQLHLVTYCVLPHQTKHNTDSTHISKVCTLSDKVQTWVNTVNNYKALNLRSPV